MTVVEIVNLVTQGGALVLLVLASIGVYKIAKDVVPSVKEFLAALVAQLGELRTKVALIEVKVDGGAAAVASRISDASGALAKVGDAVAAEALEVKLEVQASERRVTSAIRREQASDPPPSRTSVTLPSAPVRGR